MDYKGFCRELKKVKGKWYLGECGSIRKRRGDKCFCVISAVCQFMTGKFYKTEHFPDAARAIGLRYGTAISIMIASDNRWCVNIFCQDSADRKHVKIRRDLKRITRLGKVA